MERKFEIPTSDGRFLIQAKLQGTPTSDLVIMSHGGGSNMDDRLFCNAATFLESQGIASLRFNYYAPSPRCRKLINCTFEQHIADLDSVIKYAKDNWPNARRTALGHCVGAIVILILNSSEIDKALLWDCANTNDGVFRDPFRAIQLPEIEAVALNAGHHTLFSEAWVQAYESVDIGELVRNNGKPSHFIFADNCWLVEHRDDFLRNMKPTDRQTNLPDADHCFTSEKDFHTLMTVSMSSIRERDIEFGHCSL